MIICKHDKVARQQQRKAYTYFLTFICGVVSPNTGSNNQFSRFLFHRASPALMSDVQDLCILKTGAVIKIIG